MLVCACCGKPIGCEPPKSDGMEMIALIQHQKNKHWKMLEELNK